jgi:hypothetical protein
MAGTMEVPYGHVDAELRLTQREARMMQNRKRSHGHAPRAPERLLERLERGADEDLLREALAAAHYRPVARAAELAAEGLHYRLESTLADTFRRFAQWSHKRDPGCIAKGALARALVALDCLDAAFFREGIRLRQPEPVWGGSVDTAADVRVSCAMGLAASGDSGALLDLVDLLVDPEYRARIGAVRAIGCTEPRAAGAVLRTKALLGDAEPEVVAECFRVLLTLDPDASIPFVARWLDDARAGDRTLRELAALALGESGFDASVDALRAAWEAEPLRGPADRALLRAAALARSDRALDWLLSLAVEADFRTAQQVIEALAQSSPRSRMVTALEDRLRSRGDAGLLDAFREAFGRKPAPAARR